MYYVVSHSNTQLSPENKKAIGLHEGPLSKVGLLDGSYSQFEREWFVSVGAVSKTGFNKKWLSSNEIYKLRN